VVSETRVEPHPWQRRDWRRFWLCAHCFAPKSLHPRTGWVKARPLHDNRYLSADAPYFTEGW
jgi:hypothetical protein